ncbi:protein FAN-like isoform X3 [Diorhabda sublineata]|uniref:protein FAN-like isoform X3 n=1 Tax=Diorhabda sublineata TaxID=1163346 RepID=UPI0024E11F7E|nr:protein FAN-like isoform X3 [Diorhabda sublineata]
MEKERFSLLQLDPGEIYFEDFSAIFIPPDTTPKTYDNKKQDGRLKMCSKSLVFDPKDISKPIIKILFKDCVVIEQWKGTAKFLNSNNNVLSVSCKEYVELLEKNIIAPYQFKGPVNFLFLLNYASIANCLPQICQLHRASSLPAAEQADMIAAIVHSRQSRDFFDPRWMDLYEKIVLESQADKVSPLVVNPGRLVLTTSKIYFQPYNKMGEYPTKINLNSIKQIVKRRFLLRQIGLEIYSKENSPNPHVYFSFRNQALRDEFYDNMLNQQQLKLDEMRQDVVTLQWQNGIISNFEYLLYVNSLGDRTFNDLTQYPVFPWVISNYSDDKLDLTDPSNYRDLSKPVGALNEIRLNRLLDRYQEMTVNKFLYGSHYSTPGFVLYYLARLYPHYVLCLQSGRFDHPDRMFNSVADAYKNCLNNMADFKELIPQFYDVSEEGKFLVFYHLCYEGAIDLDAISDLNERHALEVQIMEFGQIPKQVFKVPHPQRKNVLMVLTEPSQIPKIDTDLNDIWKRAEGLDLVTNFNTHKHTVSNLFISEDGSKITSVGHDSKLKVFSLSQNKQIRSANVGRMALSSCIQLPNANVLIIGSWDNEIYLYDMDYGKVSDKIVAHQDAVTCLCLDMKTNVVISGSTDCTVKIWNGLNNNKFIHCLKNQLEHNSAINCLSLNSNNNNLAVGTEDGDLYIWETINFTLYKKYNHSTSITALSYSPDGLKLAIGTSDKVFKIIDVDTGLSVFNKTLNSDVTALKWSDHLLLLGCGDGILSIWDIFEVKLIFEIAAHSGAIKTVDIPTAKDLIVTGGQDRSIKVWKPKVIN